MARLTGRSSLGAEREGEGAAGKVEYDARGPVGRGEQDFEATVPVRLQLRCTGGGASSRFIPIQR